MTTSAGLARTPYQIVVAVRSGFRQSPPESVRRMRDLHKAIKWVRDMTAAWGRLCGPQPGGPYWYVVDLRDGTEHHLRDYA